MRRLTNRETRTLLDAVLVLHSNQGASKIHRRIFDAVKLPVPGEFFAIDYFRSHGEWLGREFSSTDPIDVTTPEHARIFEAYVPEHPLFNEFLRTGLATPSKITDFVTTTQFHRLGIYNEFYRLVGVDRQMAIACPVVPGIILMISLNRSKRDFTESDRKILTMLKPHLIAAHNNARALARLHLQQIALESALEKAGVGAILINLSGRMQFVTEQARAWLQKYFDAPHGSATDLPRGLTDWVAHSVSVAMTDRTLAAPVPPLEAMRADERLRIRLLIDREAGEVLLLMEEERPVSAKALESLGLTKREAEVLKWAALRKTSAEIAILCGISQRTVQKHLEHIYVKLGVNSKAAAAELALGVAKRSS